MDRNFEDFLTVQRREGLALAGASDIVDLRPLGGTAPRHYLVGFNCRGFVRDGSGNVGIAERHEIGVFFPRDYLKRANFFEVLTWLGPRDAWHPNILGPARLVCPGPMAPGTPLVDLAFQVFEIITCHRVNMRETHCLNPAACPWARANQHRFPVDDRPLKRAVRDAGDAA